MNNEDMSLKELLNSSENDFITNLKDLFLVRFQGTKTVSFKVNMEKEVADLIVKNSK